MFTIKFKIRMFLSGFQMVFDKMVPTCMDFKRLGIRFQIPFEIQTICSPTSFWTFKIQTSLDFRSTLIWTHDQFSNQHLNSSQKLSGIKIMVWIADNSNTGQVHYLDPHCIAGADFYMRYKLRFNNWSRNKKSSSGIWIENYSGGWIAEHSNSEHIQNPIFLKFGYGIVLYGSTIATAMQKTEPLENQTMCSLDCFI